MKVLVDGEGSFTTRGTIKDGHPVPTTFTSKIVSDAETSDVTMVIDEGGVKELSAAPHRAGTACQRPRLIVKVSSIR